MESALEFHKVLPFQVSGPVMGGAALGDLENVFGVAHPLSCLLAPGSLLAVLISLARDFSTTLSFPSTHFFPPSLTSLHIFQIFLPCSLLLSNLTIKLNSSGQFHPGHSLNALLA